MQFTELNAEAQGVTIATQQLDLFALSLRARLEAFVFNADASLDYLRKQKNEQLKNYLQTTIFELECLLNEFEMYDTLQTPSQTQ
ncbi:hypothetical protein [Microscilla marina]|uniref:Uncharacterized protein n=1 Tax=Microscilla marina ATCC 23134 TaxID=313606 RepID=A1ZUW1_MICM2|nr:hypothetical protein [Microscilla marina]EAY25865.1 hypothetical protein M23134_07677 [Microscilla marina ATCC 23134]